MENILKIGNNFFFINGDFTQNGNDESVEVTPKPIRHNNDSTQNITNETDHELKTVFSKAKKHINPSNTSKVVLKLYANRHVFIPFALHFVATMIIWGHFALIKFGEQDIKVPSTAPNYWWKVVTPTIEFGTMHAILFQLALLPLTMSRFSIASLSDSIVNRFLPLNKTLEMHVHLGYITICIVFASTIVFFIFFGKLCNDGEQSFCDKMRSEIMITGYIILASFLVIGGTSFYRHKIPYKVFYVVHHLVFIMYFVAILHTLDKTHRTGERSRNQNFKWFSVSLLYYVADRCVMYFNRRYNVSLISSSRIINRNGTRMIILKMNRPSLFKFKPGQHVYLANKKIDAFWHPFSIASDPASKELEFYIEVFGENSWTDKLWDESGIASNDNVKFEVMGPYGTSVEGRDDFTHGLAIGAGTGIVPIVSLYRRYVNFLLRLSPEKHSEILESRDKDIETFINDRDSRKGSYALKLFLMCKKLVTKSQNTKKTEIPTNSTSRRSRRNSIGLAKELQVNLASFDLETKHQTLGQFKNNEKKLDKMAFQAILQFYGKIVEAFFTIMCAILIGLTISWNSLPETVSFKFADHPVSLLFMQMITCLKVLTIVNHAVFLLITICIWNSDTVFALFDVAIVIVTPFADWYYFRQYSMNGQLTAIEVTTFCILTGYMMIRLWNSVVQPLGQALQSHTKDMSFSYMENLEIVWVTRSTDLVSEVFPDIEEQWKKLSDTWGQENAMKACPISIYITSKDETENSRLANKLKNSQLFRIGAFKFGRPDFGKLIEDHTIKLTDGKTFSYSLLTFCGSYKLSNHIRELKISNDLLKSLIGFQKHPMEFKSQSYGGIKHDSAHHDRLDATVSTKTKFVRNGSDDVSAFESNELKAVLDDSSEEAYSIELGE